VVLVPAQMLQKCNERRVLSRTAARRKLRS
jgi:hypothetical protein